MALATTGVLVGIALLLAVVIVGAPSVRTVLLREVIARASDELPGELNVRTVRWPALGHLWFRGVSWTDGETLLARADTLEVRADVRALIAGELRAEEIVAGGVAADVPAIVGRTAALRSRDAASPARRPLLREGVLPGVPAIAVGHLRLGIDRVALAGSVVLEAVRFDASCDLIDHASIAIARVEGRFTPPDVTVDGGQLSLSLLEGRAEGRLVLSGAHESRVVLALASAERDRFSLTISAPGGSPPADAGVTLDVRVFRPGDSARERPSRLELGIDALTPASDVLRAHPLLGERLARVPSVSGVKAVGDATIDFRDEGPAMRLGLDLAAEGWLSGGRVVAHTEPGGVAVDTLSLDLETLALDARGHIGSGAIRGVIDVRRTPFAASTSFRIETGSGTDVRLAPILVRSLDRDGRISPGPLEWREPDAARIFIGPGGDVSVETLAITGVIGELSANATLRMSGDGTPAVGEAIVRARLLDPRVLARTLPAGVDVSALGPIEGRLSVRPSVAGDLSRVAAEATFTASGWLDTLVVRGSGNRGGAKIDTALVRSMGVTFSASGTLDALATDLAVSARIDSLPLLRRFVPSLPPDVRGRLIVDGRVTGSLSDPRASAAVIGSVRNPAIAVPSFTGTASFARDGFSIDLEAPEGVTARSFVLHRARARFATHERGKGTVLPGVVAIDVDGPGVALELRALVSALTDPGRASVASIEIDTLQVSLQGNVARAAAPFGVRVSAERIAIDALRLEGELGTLSASGQLAETGSDLVVEADLRLPAPPGAPARVREFWPGELRATLIAAADSLVANACLSGFDDGGRNVTIDAGVLASAVETRVSASVTDEDDMQMFAEAALPIAVELYPMRVSAIGDSVRADLRVQNLRVPLAGEGSLLRREERAAEAEGHVRVRGTLDDPDIDAELEIGFPHWPRMAAFVLETATTLEAGELSARLHLTGGADTLVTGRVRMPVVASLHPASLEVDEGSMRASFTAENVDLLRFAPLLPPDGTIGGTCRIDLEAGGEASDPTLSGRIEANRLTVGLADGSRLAAEMDANVHGTALAPGVTGRVVVTSGLIVVPEPPKTLHPPHGEALLWNTALAASPQLEPDTLATRAGGIQTLPVTPELDVTVVIERGFWMRGRGLEIELAGEVRVRQSGVTPTVVGELAVVRGQLDILDRRLGVDRGVVTFFGDDELDPTLDVLLSSRIHDTRVFVNVTGTASAPELALSSTPEMTEGDIMSFLVLGRRLDELDDDQKGLLTERGTDVAAQLGAARVQRALGRRLGVDIIAVREGSGPAGAESLVVGKYLTRDILVKYEQALEEGAGFLVNLEYILTRRFRLETLTGEGRSGVEVNWTSEY